MKHETEFDQMISSHEQEILKAALPFLPYPEQKLMSVFIKTREFMRTLELFSDDSQPLKACANESDSTDSLTLMIETLKEYCTPSEQETLDLFFNIRQAMYLCKESQENVTEDSPFNLKNLLSNLLGPEQTETLEMFKMLQSIPQTTSSKP